MHYVLAANKDEYRDPKKKKLVDVLTNGAILIKNGLYQKALELYDEGLGINPKDVNILQNKANVLGRLNKFDEALSLYNQVLEEQPNLPMVMYNKASLLAFNGQIDEALDLLENAIQHDKMFKKMAKEDDDFDYVKNLPRFVLLTE